MFEDIHDLAARVDDPDLDVDADTVMVLRNAGPVGAPGMPEWGHLPIPAKLLRRGVSDLLRISDARMSGTSYGAVVLHVAPESAVGGPLALVQHRRPDPARRRGADPRRASSTTPSSSAVAPRGRRRRARTSAATGALYEDHVLQANEGCDLDFLRGRSPVVSDAVTYL